jgi:hypothetical protein
MITRQVPGLELQPAVLALKLVSRVDILTGKLDLSPSKTNEADETNHGGDTEGFTG